MYICIYVYIYIYSYVCVCVCVWVYIRVCISGFDRPSGGRAVRDAGGVRDRQHSRPRAWRRVRRPPQVRTLPSLPVACVYLGCDYILLPNNQRQHRTLRIQKDVLPYALCSLLCPVSAALPGIFWMDSITTSCQTTPHQSQMSADGELGQNEPASG